MQGDPLIYCNSANCLQRQKRNDFIKSTPENPVLWTGMKGASAKGRKKPNQMLKPVQHDKRVWFSVFVIPNLVRDLGLGFESFRF
jgi:hypothetical protein